MSVRAVNETSSGEEVFEFLETSESGSRSSGSFLGFSAGDWGAVGLLVLAVAGVLVEWKLLFHDKGHDDQFLVMLGVVGVYALFLGSIFFTVNAFREYRAEKNGEVIEFSEDSEILEDSGSSSNSFNYSDFIDIASLRSMDNNARRRSFVGDLNLYETVERRDAKSIMDALVAQSKLKTESKED